MWVKNELDFIYLRKNCNVLAKRILEEIYNADKEEEFIEFLENVYIDEIPTLDDLNNYIVSKCSDIYYNIGMKGEI
jgi:hypothetical protein